MRTQDMNLDNTTGQNNAGPKSNSPLKRLTASSIVGDHVVNPEGEAMGKICDLMINLTEGTIEYVVIEFGGFLGLNQKYFAIPFKALSVATEHRHAFVLNETRETLQHYPGFDKDHWPDTNLHQAGARNTPYGGFMGGNTGSEY